MAAYQCGLCSYTYDEATEGTPWNQLPDDWVCPVCGSPKSTFRPSAEQPAPPSPPPSTPVVSAVYQCGLCSYAYDEAAEGTPWNQLPDDWVCPVCGSGKSAFTPLATDAPAAPATGTERRRTTAPDDYLAEWRRPTDDFERNMADIHRMAATGHSVIEPMRTSTPSFGWNEILVKGAQLAKLPLNKGQPINTRTVIGPRAAQPLVIESPILITHMSYGALSREAKLALAKGSAAVRTAMSSGEGGILPESLNSAYRYIFEYVPNKYSVTDECLRRVDAVDIKIGQAAKPGMGGHLPGDKVTREIAKVRGVREGMDVISPARFPDIRTPDDFKRTVDGLREKTGGKPIGVKLAAGAIEDDLEIAVYAGVDFVTIDGSPGATAAAPKFLKASASVPTIFALCRARRFLDRRGANDVSLVITGSLRVSADFAKALAMGADAVAVGTAAMIALGCQQYRVCDTGRCPVGIATQDPALRARLDVDASAARVANFLRVSTEELQDFARLTGNDDVRGLSLSDLCTVNSEISNHTDIEHV